MNFAVCCLIGEKAMNKNAKWIICPKKEITSPLTFARSFSPKKKVKKACIKVSSVGNYALFINGERIGKGVLTPGWTSYKNRIQYQTYDITEKLGEENTVEIGVGNGWALSYIGWEKQHHYYSDVLMVISTIEITYENGRKEIIVTDKKWDVYTSQITFSELYHGETVDKTATVEHIGKAKESFYKTKLIPQVGEWICEQERIAPAEIIRTPKGELVVDFGQNMTGYVEFSVKGKRGDRIVVQHGEVLDKDGNFYNGNMRSARCENTYVLSGDHDVFKPTYTFQGFRYIRLAEYPFDTVDPNTIRAIVVHSEMKRTGHFVCGNEMVNQLYHNVIWGQKSNYLDVPTDCPQRDERMGWTGDAQIFCRTAAINFDVEKFHEKWFGDIKVEQNKNGSIPHVVPDAIRSKERCSSSAAWGDVCCVSVWEIYLAYGNKQMLRRYFPMMKKWVEYIHSSGPEEFLWLGGSHYGDWLAMDDTSTTTEQISFTPNDYIASAYFAYSTSLLIKAGKALGEDMSEYEALYENILKAFRKRYMKDGLPYPVPNGWDESKGQPNVRETQTAHVLALYFGLCEDKDRQKIADRLATIIRENGTRLTTGFVGTPYLLHALSENGHTDLAYELLLQEKCPSWLFSVKMGATTMWERWTSMNEDGSMNNPGMNSFNHYAYGAVFDWIFGVCTGIKTVDSSPAYREVNICPKPCRVLGFARSEIESRNGKIVSHWYYKGDDVYFEFEIPQGSLAHVTLPNGYKEDLNGGTYHFVVKA